MSSLLTRVRTRMRLQPRSRVTGMLTGGYASVFHGRSLDFADLREYEFGDDAKDIDWKATARSGQVLVRRYVASRNQHVLLVVNTGRSMTALAPSGESKRDLVLNVVGVLGWVVRRSGDLLALVEGSATAVTRMPLRGTHAHLESVLRTLDAAMHDQAGASAFGRVLEEVARRVSRRHLVVLVTDTAPRTDAEEHLLRRIRAQHEVILIQIADVNAAEPAWAQREVFDIATEAELPRFVRQNRAVQRASERECERRAAADMHTFERLRIPSVVVGSVDDVIPALTRLFEKQRHDRRR